MPSENNKAEPQTPEPNLQHEISAHSVDPNLNVSQTVKPQGVKKLVIGIVIAIVVFTGLAFLVLSPMSPLVSPKPPGGPALSVGQNPYVYACSVFDTSVVAKTLGVSGDKNQQSIQTSHAFAQDNYKDKKLDILKTDENPTITSDCRLHLGVADDGGAKLTEIGLSLEQFTSSKEAKSSLEGMKTGSNAKTLPSFPDSMYHAPVSQNATQGYVQASVLHKNLILKYIAPLAAQDAKGEQIATQLDTITKDVIKRIDNKEGLMPKNFNGYTRVGKSPLIDSCQSVDYRKLMETFGNGSQINPWSIGAQHAMAPTTNKGKIPKSINSSCYLGYRTQTEIDSEKASTKKSKPGDSIGRFPHSLVVQTYSFANTNDAKKFLGLAKDNVKIEEEIDKNMKHADVAIGDGTLRVTTNSEGGDPSTSQTPLKYDVQTYYMVDGPYVYLFANSFVRQTQPFKTTDQKFTDTEAKKVFKVLHKARLYAERTVK
ncbi:MAG TPA: hypothetical protein VF733_02130 [Candidatus Saccharimonadales bacterium]